MNDKKFHILSFKHAFEGIISALKQEPNLKIHFSIALLVILVSIFLKVSKIDWVIIILLIGIVITLELTNTAIEAIVDEFTERQHPGAKLAKDISSGAVLIISITAVIVGFLLFLPYLFSNG